MIKGYFWGVVAFMDCIYSKCDIAEKLLMTIEECEELFAIYLNEYEEKRNLFFLHSRHNEYDKLAKLAHSFKGSSYSLMLKPMGDIFYQIELDAKKNDTEHLVGYVEILDKLIEDFKKQIC